MSTYINKDALASRTLTPRLVAESSSSGRRLHDTAQGLIHICGDIYPLFPLLPGNGSIQSSRPLTSHTTGINTKDLSSFFPVADSALLASKFQAWHQSSEVVWSTLALVPAEMEGDMPLSLFSTSPGAFNYVGLEKSMKGWENAVLPVAGPPMATFHFLYE